MTSRTDKYAAKFSPDAVRTRFADVKTIAQTRQSDSTLAYEQLDSDVRAILSANVVPIFLRAGYMGSARKMKKVCLKYGLGASAEAEVDAIIAMDTARGLAANILAALKTYMGFS